MRKRIVALCAVILLLTGSGFAEVWQGVTAALEAQGVFTRSAGTLASVEVTVGETVESGSVLGEFGTEKVFANEDGTVARIRVHEGETCAEEVLEVMPVEKYKIYCTVTSAYEDVDSMKVHSGEQVYIKCTSNGSHRGVGTVTQIDGSTYSVLVFGGEFHVGETVYLYRDADFTSKLRVGIGTVVENDTTAYTGSGKVLRMHVQEGEFIERGELLYETIGEQGTQICAPVSGIVTEVLAENGARVETGQKLFTVVDASKIGVRIDVDETTAAAMRAGDAVELTCENAAGEETAPGRILRVAHISEEDTYAVWILPEGKTFDRLGMTVTVRTFE